MSTYDKTGKDEKKKRFLLQEHVEWIAVAFVLALTVRCFIVEAYQIPTGSMAPTLYGRHLEITCAQCGATFAVRGNGGFPAEATIICPSCGEDVTSQGHSVAEKGGDRILVSKNLYLVQKPRRWDVFVFKSPADGKADMNFVKRLVGFPGETLELKDGQLFINGEIARKPPEVQKRLWHTVYAPYRQPSALRYWSAGSAWEMTDEAFVLPELVAGWQTVEYIPAITDSYTYNGGSGINEVSDLLFSGHAVVERDGGMVAAGIHANGNTYRVVFSTAPTALNVELRVNERREAEKRILTSRSKDFRFSFSVVDGFIEATVNGQAAIRASIPLTPDDVPLYTRRSGVFLQGAGSEMAVRDVYIKRDIYYRADLVRSDRRLSHSFRVTIPKGQYFGLGDNSPISNDSREWGFIPRENILGKAFFVFWPPGRLGPVS